MDRHLTSYSTGYHQRNSIIVVDVFVTNSTIFSSFCRLKQLEFVSFDLGGMLGHPLSNIPLHYLNDESLMEFLQAR